MEQLTLRNALRHPQLHDQLILHDQPQVALDSGRIVGVEALVRWHHPPRGPLWPAEFIPIAEQAGLVHHIGEWVLLEACAQARTWTERGCPPVRIAINVSAREIRSHALIERVERALANCWGVLCHRKCWAPYWPTELFDCPFLRASELSTCP
jgi:EAL domain-containing protein (putative c-di-GMP-specific phosphodiesterase class I)